MRYLEDFTVGEMVTTSSACITEAEILAFAAQFDPQPMHMDRELAAAGPLHGLAASGWHTTAVVMRLIVDSTAFWGGPILGLGVDELRWPTPARPDDIITAQIEVVSITPSRSRPGHGVVRIGVTARNQHGATVLAMFPNLWVPRRPAV